MATEAETHQWAREALALTIYECLLATASRMGTDAQRVAGEAAWRHPGETAWQRWLHRRKVGSDVTRQPPE